MTIFPTRFSRLYLRGDMSVTLLEENQDHLSHGTTGLITWQVQREEQNKSRLPFVLFNFSAKQSVINVAEILDTD